MKGSSKKVLNSSGMDSVLMEEDSCSLKTRPDSSESLMPPPLMVKNSGSEILRRIE